MEVSGPSVDMARANVLPYCLTPADAVKALTPAESIMINNTAKRITVIAAAIQKVFLLVALLASCLVLSERIQQQESPPR